MARARLAACCRVPNVASSSIESINKACSRLYLGLAVCNNIHVFQPNYYNTELTAYTDLHVDLTPNKLYLCLAAYHKRVLLSTLYNSISCPYSYGNKVRQSPVYCTSSKERGEGGLGAVKKLLSIIIIGKPFFVSLFVFLINIPQGEYRLSTFVSTHSLGYIFKYRVPTA